MKNKNGFISMTLVYTFLILFLFLMTGILSSYNQRNKYYDIIEDKIKSEMNLTSFRNNTFYNTILKDNIAYPDNNNASPSVTNSSGIDFTKSSDLNNGVGLFYTADTSITVDNKTVYYFRGKNVNNYVLVDDVLYRIIRTTENGNVKLIKEEYKNEETGKCVSSAYNSVETAIKNSKFTKSGNYLVGYMYGYENEVSGYDTEDSEYKYLATHKNSNDSDIKYKLDKFAKTINSNLIATSYYCNNRTIDTNVVKISDVTLNSSHDYEVSKILVGFEQYNTVYHNVNRLKKERKLVYICPRVNDDGEDVDYIETNVGLITIDEAIYSGIGIDSIDSNREENDSFINETITMSPNYYFYDEAGIIYIGSSDVHTVNATDGSSCYLPVITVNGKVIISKGNGTYDNPYIIKGA